MQTPARKGLAVADRSSHLRLWLTAGLGLALDLAAKSLGWTLLGGLPPPDGTGREIVLIPGWLRLVASLNPGIVFGFNFSQMLGVGPVAGRVLTVVLTLATSALIFYVFAASQPGQKWMHAWCGLILAGALGNLYDRMMYERVRDFIQITAHAEVGGLVLQWPYVFNLADIYLVVGVVAVALVYLSGRGPQHAETRPPHAKDARHERP
ncbi:MAG: signal peptidase II [Planctomycetes bacterium]|nr:signal peptidase II [Planctomycetota bacterium]